MVLQKRAKGIDLVVKYWLQIQQLSRFKRYVIDKKHCAQIYIFFETSILSVKIPKGIFGETI